MLIRFNPEEVNQLLIEALQARNYDVTQIRLTGADGGPTSMETYCEATLAQTLIDIDVKIRGEK